MMSGDVDEDDNDDHADDYYYCDERGTVELIHFTHQTMPSDHVDDVVDDDPPVYDRFASRSFDI